MYTGIARNETTCIADKLWRKINNCVTTIALMFKRSRNSVLQLFELHFYYISNTNQLRISAQIKPEPDPKSSNRQ